MYVSIYIFIYLYLYLYMHTHIKEIIFVSNYWKNVNVIYKYEV